jgi:hypothetical protein
VRKRRIGPIFPAHLQSSHGPELLIQRPTCGSSHRSGQLPALYRNRSGNPSRTQETTYLPTCLADKMDERARIPVTIPVDNPTQSYWQDPPDPEIANLRTTTDLPTTADTLIIGSGITGAAIAWNLLQKPSAQSIVMLEARQACSGATGRNGTPSLSTCVTPRTNTS